jgi:hypothetical protein
MSKSNRRIVTFELPKSVFDSLQEDTQVRGANSVHQRAREIIIDHASNQHINDLVDRVESLDTEVSHVGDLIRRVAYSVIVHASGKTSKEANAWIREHMPNRSE